MIRDLESFLNKAKTSIVSPKVIISTLAMIAVTSSVFSHTIDASTLDSQAVLTETSIMNNSAEFLSDRPETPLFHVPGTTHVKMVESTEEALGHDDAKNLAAFARIMHVQNYDKGLSGYAVRYEKEQSNLRDTICMIAHEQSQNRIIDDFYIDPDNQIPAMLPRHYVDFFVKSHEAGHCSFWVKAPDDNILLKDIYTSVNEVAADLTAMIDYMRVTGNDDAYNDYIRPFRVGSVGMTTHKTAWALDVILKDINPSVMQGKEPSEIPEIVNYLMNKHIMKDDMSGIDMDKKATRQIVMEVSAARDIISGSVDLTDERTVNKLKKDASTTVFRQIQRYATVVDNPQLIQYHIDSLQASMNDFGLPDPKGHWRPRMKGLDESISKHSYAEHFMGR